MPAERPRGGVLGDGINDSAALKAADAGISVDTAVDIAGESADIILLEKNLGVLGDPHYPHGQGPIPGKPGIALPFTFIGGSLGFVPLPPLYWPVVMAIIGCYAILTHVTKVWFVRRWGM
jgi:hypothetical protein